MPASRGLFSKDERETLGLRFEGPADLARRCFSISENTIGITPLCAIIACVFLARNNNNAPDMFDDRIN